MGGVANLLDEIVKRCLYLEEKLRFPEKIDSQEFAKLSKEYSDLRPKVELIDKRKKLQDEIEYLSALLKNSSEDPEIREIAKTDLQELQVLLPKLELDIKKMLIPKDKDDSLNVILEVRAGTGGDEAALFAASLFNMYHKYAERMKWKFEIISISHNEIGGYKEATASISGSDVFSKLKFESGVHRVQRVPETESSGRIHTSTATVAVLPEPEDVDVKINDKDLRIDVYRSSGPGGQSVNTTDSAVRITHIPTGIVVMQQDEKSQHKNRAKAMKILKVRLYEIERSKVEKEISSMRKSQIGSGERSEKTRTYNFPQGRITDHRINLTVYRINETIKEGELEPIIDALVRENEVRILAGIESENTKFS
ncbi:peptide chain release factor 1 [Neorickettsia helminthoeca str. Oregon]|uniref:Peptide chain release factor 1 n=1 Tax=Neorickettsia helminthoeca str. Oregon TaxID=1286528 RepID=X5HLP1_9RICK|nr:peptide chain release factor 1 [Neorickettsia helminthoeca]AHX11335.1 peptide chain release factor 1 [Neorickettsia helminthoeca str. Oregon]